MPERHKQAKWKVKKFKKKKFVIFDISNVTNRTKNIINNSLSAIYIHI